MLPKQSRVIDLFPYKHRVICQKKKITSKTLRELLKLYVFDQLITLHSIGNRYRNATTLAVECLYLFIVCCSTANT